MPHESPAPAALTDLDALLRGLSPRCHPRRYVFVTVPPGVALPERGVAICEVREAEGTTLVVDVARAHELGFAIAEPQACITLEVHSSLASVGLTAAVSRALAAAGIPCNVVAGYHHDHLFVPDARAAEAVTILGDLRPREGGQDLSAMPHP